jgi:hypothetical protein
MKLLRQVELHQQGFVILSPDKDGNIKRDVEEKARQGDWQFTADGVSKLVMWDGLWHEYIEEPQTLDEFLRAEEDRQQLIKSAKPLATAVDCLRLALKPEHETVIMKIEAVGVNCTSRTAEFSLGAVHYTETPKSALTLEDSAEILECVLKVATRRLDAVKTKLGVR